MADNLTSPSAIFAPDVVLTLADERMFNDTGLINSAYVVDARATAAVDHAANNVCFLYYADVTGNNKIQTNTVDGTELDGDGHNLKSETITLSRGIYNTNNDASALRNLANTVDPDSFLADAFVKYMNETILKAIYTKCDASTNKKDISGGSGSAAYPTLKGIKGQAAKWFGERARKERPALVMHSTPLDDIENDSSVVTANNYNNTDPSQTPWMGLQGFNVIASDLVTVSGTGSSTKYNSYVLLPGAVEIYVKINEDMFGNSVRVPNTSLMNTIFTFDYAVHVKRDSIVPVGVYQSKSALDA